MEGGYTPYIHRFYDILFQFCIPAMLRGWGEVVSCSWCSKKGCVKPKNMLRIKGAVRILSCGQISVFLYKSIELAFKTIEVE